MVQTTVRLPKELYEKLKEQSKKRGMTMNAFVINLLWECKNVEHAASGVEEEVK